MKLRQSTAITIQIGPFLDSTDGISPEPSLTIAQTDVRLSKAGAAFAQKGETSSATHDENGFYRVAFNTTDTGTVGKLIIAVFATGAVPVWHEFEVVPANVYDSLVAGTDMLNADITQVTGTSVTDIDDFKANVSNLDVAVSTRSNHSAADVWSNADRTVTGGTIDTCTTNTDMRGTDGAVTDLAGVATEVKQDTIISNQTTINDNVLTRSTFDSSTDEVTTNPESREASKADVSGLSTFDPASDTVDIGRVNGVTVDGAGTEADSWGPA